MPKDTIKQETKQAKETVYMQLQVDFNKSLTKAVDLQNKSNAAWHEAQKLAVRMASGEHRNLEPANRMIAAVYECKSMRVMSLVKFMMYLGGESIAWDAKTMKLSYKRKSQSIPEIMVKYSDRTPFWEHAPEAITQLVEFNTVIAAIKKLRNAANGGKAKATHEELTLLGELEKLIVKHNPAAFEKRGNK